MKDQQDWRQLYPFDSHELFIDSHRYHYLDEGRGDVLLMVHGNPTWSFYWRNLVSVWRSEFRVVVPDHIGCGLSSKPQSYAYRLDQHISNLVQLVEELDLRNITLMAHDWGGAIGLGTALACPHRFARMILFNTGAFPPPYVPWRIRACRIPFLGTLAIRGCNLFARSALTMATSQLGGLHKDVASGLLAPYDNWHNRVAIDAFVRDIPMTRAHPTHQTLARIERNLVSFQEYPCQLIWGMRDWCFRPSCLERLVDCFPSAEVQRIQTAGHYVVEDAYREIVPMVEQFLATHPLSSSAKVI